MSPQTVTGERAPDLDQIEYHLELLEREFRNFTTWARERGGDLVAIVQDAEAQLEEEWGGTAAARLSHGAYEGRELIRRIIRGQLGLVHPDDPRFAYVESQRGKLDSYERDDAPWRIVPRERAA